MAKLTKPMMRRLRKLQLNMESQKLNGFIHLINNEEDKLIQSMSDELGLIITQNCWHMKGLKKIFYFGIFPFNKAILGQIK